MPATIVRFQDLSRPPQTAFLDTSFIRELIRWSNHPGDPRCAASHAFYQTTRAHNTRLWTTPFAAEEILWPFVRDELFRAMRPFGHATIAEFKRGRRDEYLRTLESCRPHLQTMIRALNRLRISFEFPGDQAAMRGNWGAQVVQVAGQLLERFPLETADAFHIACAWAAGTNHVVSLDEEFKTVDGLTVYCFA